MFVHYDFKAQNRDTGCGGCLGDLWKYESRMLKNYPTITCSKLAI